MLSGGSVFSSAASKVGAVCIVCLGCSSYKEDGEGFQMPEDYIAPQFSFSSSSYPGEVHQSLIHSVKESISFKTLNASGKTCSGGVCNISYDVN